MNGEKAQKQFENRLNKSFPSYAITAKYDSVILIFKRINICFSYEL